MAEASKIWLLTLLEIMQEQLKPGVCRLGTQASPEQYSGAAVSGFVACDQSGL